VFLPCTEKRFKKTQNWMQERGIFDERLTALDYASL
jgi:hypothetical protein